MIVRTSVIGMVAAGMVVFGTGANAGALPGASPAPEPVSAEPAERYVTVVNVYGDNNVIATDRSVVATGDGTRLNANAGDVSSSGTLGIDTENSTLESGASTSGTAPDKRYAPGPTISPEDGQSTSISGYEDHSVTVSGEDQIAVYDDSNLFINRNGHLNANTGDTDSSGLNAVDVSGSTVASGNHTEDGENGDDDEDKEEEAPPPPTPPTGPAPAPDRQTAVPTGAPGPPNGQVSSTVTDEGESSATGKSTLTIGADGYDDLGTDLHGNRNIVTYDDSNVVIGGTGDVNAQIGDSDTSGAVVMGVDDSDVRSGNST